MTTRRRLALGLIVIGLLPLASVIVAGAIAKTAGCTLHEGFATPCPILGVDLGGLLYSMGVMGWLMLVSLPLAALGIIALLLDLIIAASRRF